jgi:hypothetical protein
MTEALNVLDNMARGASTGGASVPLAFSDGLPGLFLSDTRPIDCISAGRDIFDFEGDEIAAPQLLGAPNLPLVHRIPGDQVALPVR